MRLPILILILITIISCNNSSENVPKETAIHSSEDSTAIENVEKKDEAPIEVVTESKYQYDKEWEVFKKAVINKDIKGVSVFASSDAVDAEFLINVMDNEIFHQKLKETKYEDLTVNVTDSGVSIEFHAVETAIDEDGNEVGSAITIYFTEGEQFLELDYFVVAG